MFATHTGIDVPPPQCPECGRFLATAFVEAIATEPAPCPGCGTELPPPAATPEEVEPEPETSVRPPDLPADPGQPADPDPLAGWDQSPTTFVSDHGPDPAAVATGAGAGLLLGLLLGGRDHRGLGALLGAVLGAVLASLRR